MKSVDTSLFYKEKKKIFFLGNLHNFVEDYEIRNNEEPI